MRLRPQIPLLLTALLFPTAALPQSAPAAATVNLISLRLLDADSGQPIPNLRVYLYGDTGGTPLPVTILGDLYEVDITAQTSLKLGQITSTASSSIDFTACVPQDVQAFNVKQVQVTGLAPQNKCSKQIHPAAPGELVLFLRRTHWYERWKNMY